MEHLPTTRDGAQARLEPEQAAKINVPVLLLTGEKSTDPAKAAVGAVAAALPNVRLSELAGQQHVAGIMDPETFVTRAAGFPAQSDAQPCSRWPA
jgi:pimeloyl-ACP methyl ester carboxylesterase